MRLWHKNLINVLPRQQLLSQWRECCCIARNIKVNGTPNHLLVNKVLEYDLEHFYTYSMLIVKELKRRGYKCDITKLTKWFEKEYDEVPFDKLFKSWHNNRYLKQCFFNLQEKYDCGGIIWEEWRVVILKINL